MTHSTMLDQVNQRAPRRVRRALSIKRGSLCLMCAALVALAIKCFVIDVVISGTQQTQIDQCVKMLEQSQSNK